MIDAAVQKQICISEQTNWLTQCGPQWKWMPQITCSSESSELVPWFTGKGIRPSETEKPGMSVLSPCFLATVLVPLKGKL